ncbi:MULTISPECIES: SRPBCC family protein [unclassified Nocardioides]|uniref:SRPBCC family protein n=1 Tax=unclassified Nocardioides TaxID=2615069 RepID=UPI003014D04C
MRASYAFADAWHLDAAPEAVRDVLVDLERYPEWWPQVRAVASLGPDEARVVCRSALPYALDLVLRAVSRELPVLEVAVAGDLSGTVRFRLAPSYGGTLLRLEQEVSVSGLLGTLSPLVRPVLTWNHDRMMRGCVAGLRRRLGPSRPAR